MTHVAKAVIKGKHFQLGEKVKRTMGCPHTGEPVIEWYEHQGWWEYPDGTEGGDLHVSIGESGELTVEDFDGVYDLPQSVREDLKEHNIKVDF